jgi:hypothetical protein
LVFFSLYTGSSREEIANRLNRATTILEADLKRAQLGTGTRQRIELSKFKRAAHSLAPHFAAGRGD